MSGRAPARLGAVAGLVGLLACGPSESPNLALRFANEAMRAAVQRILVLAAPPETLDCATALEAPLSPSNRAPWLDGLRARQRDSVLRSCRRGRCEDGWFAGPVDLTLSPGRHQIVALAAVDTDFGRFVYRGCASALDLSGEGPLVDLEPRPPDESALSARGPRRLFARRGGLVELGVEFTGPVDISGADRRALPGSEVALFVEGGVGGRPERASALVDADGRADLSVRLADRAEAGRAAVRYVGRGAAEVAPITYTLRAFEPPEVAALDLGPFPAPRRAAAARHPGGFWVLAVLGCEGGPEACAADPARTTRGVFGGSRIDVAHGVGGRFSPASVEAASLGAAPADLAFVRTGADLSLLALSARRPGCLDRICRDPRTCSCFVDAAGAACPCESSSIVRLGYRGGAWRWAEALVTTASTALALAAVEGEDRIAVAAAGRSPPGRPCAPEPRCLEWSGPACRSAPGTCGCPPGETCRPQREGGVCRREEAEVELVTLGDQPDRGGTCRDPALGLSGPPGSEVACCANAGAPPCVRDGCGDPVPPRRALGPGAAPPRDAAMGRLVRDSARPDLAVASAAGLDLLRWEGGRLVWDRRPALNDRMDRLVLLNLDPEVERAVGGPAIDDVVFVSAAPCGDGEAETELCPLETRAPGPGCLGYARSGGAPDLVSGILGREPPRCGRRSLDRLPRALCRGDFDGDDHLDVAVGFDGRVDFLLGGADGDLSSPVSAALPAGRGGGPMACADFDEDGRAEVVVVDRDGRGAWRIEGPG